MGDYANDYIESSFYDYSDRIHRGERDIEDFPINPSMIRNEDEWTLKDGTIVKINKMTTRHIENCIKLLKKKGGSMKQIEIFEQELKSR